MNWRDEAAQKLRRLDAMRHALDNLPREVDRLEQEAVGLLGSPDRLMGNLRRREVLGSQLRQTRSWVTSVERAMEVLSPEERLVLDRFYVYPRRGAADRLAEELGVERSQVYRKKDQALKLFTLAMFGE